MSSPYFPFDSYILASIDIWISTFVERLELDYTRVLMIKDFKFPLHEGYNSSIFNVQITEYPILFISDVFISSSFWTFKLSINHFLLLNFCPYTIFWALSSPNFQYQICYAENNFLKLLSFSGSEFLTVVWNYWSFDFRMKPISDIWKSTGVLSHSYSNAGRNQQEFQIHWYFYISHLVRKLYCVKCIQNVQVLEIFCTYILRVPRWSVKIL